MGFDHGHNLELDMGHGANSALVVLEIQSLRPSAYAVLFHFVLVLAEFASTHAAQTVSLILI